MADRPQQIGTRRAIRVTQAALIGIALGLCIAGRRFGAWPIAGWTVYSTKWPEVPGPVTSAIELRVTYADGLMRAVRPEDLYPFERISGLERIVEHAFRASDTSHREADRAYLLALIGRRSANGAVQVVEGWELRWNTDPWSVPPLDRDRPVKVTLLGSFAGRPTP